MNAMVLMREASESGIVFRLDKGKITARGNPEALAAMVPRLREHRPELLKFLVEAHNRATALTEAAMRACDHHADNAQAREQMKADCMSTPRPLWDDLMEHFQRSYPRRLR